MNYTEIEKSLSEFPQGNVKGFLNYLQNLENDTDKEGKKRNPWFQHVKEKTLIELFKKVAEDGLTIDGETIILQYKGKLSVEYGYQAYKNRVLLAYPETIFDIQLVTKGDDFSFRKESGKVIYSHKISDPFNTNPEIIGMYCIIKNRRGEFLETLNMTEINKMKATAKTKNVWDTWLSEMILKSGIKRACKRHFKDVITNIERLDNENYDPELVSFDDEIVKKINEAQTFDELNNIYRQEKNNVSDKIKFMTLLTDRKNELMELLPEIKQSEINEAVEMLRNGKKKDSLYLIWKIDDDTMEEIISKAAE